MTKSALVITSINENAESFDIYDTLDSFHLILIGDKKGPTNDPLKNGTFLGVNKQHDLQFSCATILPYNHYCRKNLGYLYAMQRGYTEIFETDDDNIPNDNFPPNLEKITDVDTLTNTHGFVNIYSEYSDLVIWPRGYPLSKLSSQGYNNRVKSKCNIGVWQGLANLDPDVDAINRLILNYTDVHFTAGRYAIGRENFCPFNSQNTTWYQEAFPLMYLPCTVPFRMTDILRSFVAQRIMWHLDLLLGFHEATVEQARNDHNLMDDFTDEQSMYLDTEGIIAVLNDQNLQHKTALQSLEQCYQALIQAGYVDDTEMKYLNAWIDDVTKLNVP